MRVKIEFSTDNAAFEESLFAEVQRVLLSATDLVARSESEVMARRADGYASSVVTPLRDSNGNMIGSVIVTADDGEG